MKNLLISLMFTMLVACATTTNMPSDGNRAVVGFDDLFATQNDGMYSPKYPTAFKSVSFLGEVSFTGDVEIDGVKIDDLKDKQITVRNDNGVMVIERIK